MNNSIITIALYLLMSPVLIFGQIPGFRLKSSKGFINVNRFSRYSYASFELQEPESFILISEIPVSSVSISPLNEKIPFTFDSKVIRFTILKPGYLLIRINDSVKVFLFAERPLSKPSKEFVDIVKSYGTDNTGQICETFKIQQALDDISGSGKILYFPPGIYKSGQLKLKSNTSIHLPAGAELIADTSTNRSFYSTDKLETKRFIYMNGVENIDISGHGTINGYGHILRGKYGDDARMRLILAAKCRNVRISGIILKDPGSWNTQIILCEDVIFKNVKLLNDIDLANTDGFDPDASKGVLIENCFAYCGDDNVAVKTTNNSGLLGDVDSITVRGCVFLTKKSSLKVGTETRAEFMKNITFENNDVLECDRGIAIYVSDGAILENIIYSNNRFERNYPDAQRKGIHILVSKRNPDSKLGSIKNILIRDCTFERSFPRKSVIKSEGVSADINVTIENMTVAGHKAFSLESAEIEVSNASVVIR